MLIKIYEYYKVFRISFQCFQPLKCIKDILVVLKIIDDFNIKYILYKLFIFINISMMYNIILLCNKCNIYI